MNAVDVAAKDSALSYLRAGLSVIPIRARDKRPLVAWQDFQRRRPTADEVAEWWGRWPNAGIGIVTGAVSGVVVLDVDGVEGRESLKRVAPVPVTWRVATARGEHLYFRHPGGTVSNFVKRVPGLDLRGDGGYAVAPPSPHPSGRRYEWTTPPDEADLAECPEWLIHLTVQPPGDNRQGAPFSVPEKIDQGERNTSLYRCGRALKAKGLNPEEILAALRAVNAGRCEPPLSEAEVRAIAWQAATQADRPDFLTSAQGPDRQPDPYRLEDRRPHGMEPSWAAQSAPDFLNAAEPEQPWLEAPILAPGAITEAFSPRGIGKTHFTHAYAVRLAKRGIRVLLLDRDNSRREVRRRLRGWGAGSVDVATLKVKTRDGVPPLTDAAAWATFPFKEYDLVIIDSLDASAEGVGEKDSAKPSKAIAPILDVAHRAGGPAVLVLGNTIKSGEHGRGSGVIEDRADISFEVRDATDFTPSGTKPWWQELPPAGVGAWAERASRRKRRASYRLAFVPSKFRVGEEPDPFSLEIDLATEPWTLRDVTAEVVEAGEVTRQEAERQHQAKLDTAARALVQEIQRRAKAEDLMLTEKEAVPFLMGRGLTRAEARQLITDREGPVWRIVTLADRRGHPKALFPAGHPDGGQSKNLGGNKPSSGTPELTRAGEATFSADRMDTGRQKTSSAAAAPRAGIRDFRLFPPGVSDSPPEAFEEVDL